MESGALCRVHCCQAHNHDWRQPHAPAVALPRLHARRCHGEPSFLIFPFGWSFLLPSGDGRDCHIALCAANPSLADVTVSHASYCVIACDWVLLGICFMTSFCSLPCDVSGKGPPRQAAAPAGILSSALWGRQGLQNSFPSSQHCTSCRVSAVLRRPCLDMLEIAWA